jgi:hypothetical protein
MYHLWNVTFAIRETYFVGIRLLPLGLEVDSAHGDRFCYSLVTLLHDKIDSNR